MEENMEIIATASVKQHLQLLKAKLQLQHLTEKKSKLLQDLAILEVKNKSKKEEVELMKENVKLIISSSERIRRCNKQKDEYASLLQQKISDTKTKFEQTNKTLESQIEIMKENEREMDKIYESYPMARERASRNNELKLVKINHMIAVRKLQDQYRKNEMIKDINNRRFNHTVVQFVQFCLDNWKQQRDLQELISKRTQKVEEVQQKRAMIQSLKTTQPKVPVEIPKINSTPVTRKSSFSSIYEHFYGKKSKTLETRKAPVDILTLKSESYKPPSTFTAPSQSTLGYLSSLAMLKPRNANFLQFIKRKPSKPATFLIQPPVNATPTQNKLVEDTLVNTPQENKSNEVVLETQENPSQTQTSQQSQSQSQRKSPSQSQKSLRSQPPSQLKSLPRSHLKSQLQSQSKSLQQSYKTASEDLTTQGSSEPSNVSQVMLMTVKDNPPLERKKSQVLNDGEVVEGAKRRKIDENITIIDIQVVEPPKQVSPPEQPEDDSYIFANNDLLTPREVVSPPITFLSFDDSAEKVPGLDITNLMENDPEVDNYQAAPVETNAPSGFGIFGGGASKPVETKRSLFSFL